LSQEIWFNAQLPYQAAQDRAWGAALTLIALTLLLTVAARVLASRFALKR
jgi:phosphate transport system permease protein